ncbi:MAG: hypothetical protein ACRCVU_12580 [Flavobacterium sp.]
MVRLEEGGVSTAKASIRFQYLYGAVRTKQVLPVRGFTYDFNTYMVRLEGGSF